ncbi:MAG: DUF5658 family protein [Candidatus Tectomicrobia bacterium]|nr:DUF5658 family protein [Candidatus Tectomicrobia bacterium]
MSATANEWTRCEWTLPGGMVPLIVGRPHQFRWLHGLIQAILILNLLDAVLTLFWVRTGLAEEANAFLQLVVNEHAVAFVMAKTTVVALSSLLLWKRRYHPLAVIGLFVAFIVYYCLFLHHVRFAGFLLPYFLF